MTSSADTKATPSKEYDRPMSVVIAQKDDINESNDMTELLDEIEEASPPLKHKTLPRNDGHSSHDDIVGSSDARDDIPDRSFDDGVSLWSSPLTTHKNIANMVMAGRNAVKHGGGIELLRQKLVPYLYELSDKTPSREYDRTNTIQRTFLNEWIEELLRFLALKTVTEDFTEPFELYPGYAITLAWKMLVDLPLVYSKVCTDMGNIHAFQFETLPPSGKHNEIYRKHQRRRYHGTLRVYSSYFEQQPPKLYWALHPLSYYKPNEKKDESVMTTIKQLLCMEPEMES